MSRYGLNSQNQSNINNKIRRSISSLLVLFATDGCECARSSRRWWWWCVRMKQFQVSKKQIETSQRTNERERADERNKKKKKLTLTDSDRITIIHTPKNVRVSLSLRKCARLYSSDGSWLGPSCTPRFSLSFYGCFLFTFFGYFSIHANAFISLSRMLCVSVCVCMRACAVPTCSRFARTRSQ